MKMTIDEIFSEAIMSSTKMIIVEGTNDPKIYFSIASECNIELDIHCIGNIEGYAGGCNGVVEAITSLYEMDTTNNPIHHHILGIIDKDTRDFRGEAPTIPAILMLRYYSIESHFTSKETLKHCISTYSRAHSSQIPESFIDSSEQAICELLMEIYYPSVEALKYSLQPGYNADFQYSFKPGRLYDQEIKLRLQEKKAELDQFASDLGITRSRETLNLIAHGRWLLATFSKATHHVLSTMHNYCGHDELPSCRFCRAGDKPGCTHKIKDGISSKTVYSGATEHTQIESVKYIRDRIESMHNIATA